MSHHRHQIRRPNLRHRCRHHQSLHPHLRTENLSLDQRLRLDQDRQQDQRLQQVQRLQQGQLRQQVGSLWKRLTSPQELSDHHSTEWTAGCQSRSIQMFGLQEAQRKQCRRAPRLKLGS